MVLPTRGLVGDVRHALRRWRLRPGFALTTIVTLAIGIGTTAALFSVVDGVLLKPLPWHEPERLVVIHAVDPSLLQQPPRAAEWNRAALGWREWEALRKTSAFTHVAAWMPNAMVINTAVASQPEIVDGMYVSSNLLATLGIRPHLGRFFTAAEDTFVEAEHSDAVIASYEAWQRYFAGDPRVFERTLYLSANPQTAGRPHRIVGILPPETRFLGRTPQFLRPIGYHAYNGSFATNRFLRGLARLAPGVSVEQAHASAEPIVRGTEPPARRTARVVPLTQEELGDQPGNARSLWALLGGAGLLLLVSFGNVAGLLVSEARTRRHEIAVRASLGGGFGRVLRQLAVEQVLLATLASAAGVLVAYLLTPTLVAMAPEQLPRLDTVRIDWRIAGVALGLGFATTLLCALAPVIALTRTPASLVLAEGGRDGALNRRLGQRLLLAVELALSLVLLVVASLFAESIFRLTANPLGFEPANLTVATIQQAGRPYNPPARAAPTEVVDDGPRPSTPPLVGGPARAAELTRRVIAANSTRTAAILASLAALDGAGHVAGVSFAPFVATPPSIRVRPDGEPATSNQLVSSLDVTEGYFRAIGIDVVRGRGFDRTDSYGVRTVIVSRELERRVFGGDALGKRLMRSSMNDAYDVVGVVENAKHREFTEDDKAVVYFPDQGFRALPHFLIRSTGDTSHQTLDRAVRAADLRMVVTASWSMATLVARTVAEPTFRARLAGVFAIIALLISAVGSYALASRAVADRRREIAVRVAIGAAPGDVRRLIIGDTLRTIAIGLMLGLPGAYVGSQATRSWLFGVSPTAPHIFAVAAASLAVAAVVATLLPASRAARVDPMLALKN